MEERRIQKGMGIIGPSKTAIICENSPSAWLPTENALKVVKTLNDAVEYNAPTLWRMIQSGKLDATRALVEAWLLKLDTLLALKKGLSREEAEIASDEICRRWGGEVTPADLSAWVREVVTGVYGETYESLTCAKIIQWLGRYVERRRDAIGEKHRQEDAIRYGISSAENVLNQLGYQISAEGKISIDKERVDQWREEREQRREAQARAESERKAKLAEAVREYWQKKEK